MKVEQEFYIAATNRGGDHSFFVAAAVKHCLDPIENTATRLTVATAIGMCIEFVTDCTQLLALHSIGVQPRQIVAVGRLCTTWNVFSFLYFLGGAVCYGFLASLGYFL